MVSRSPFALGVFVGSALLPFFGGCGGQDVDRFRAKLASEPGIIEGVAPGAPAASGGARGDSGIVPNSDAAAGQDGQSASGGRSGSGGSGTTDSGSVGDSIASGGAVGSGDAGGPDASVASGGAGSGSLDGGMSDAANANGSAGFAVTFDVGYAAIDIAVDRASDDTYVSIKPEGSPFLVKIRPNGAIAWRKEFPGGGLLLAPLLVDAAGNVVIASSYSDATILGLDGGVSTGSGVFVAKYTPAGARVFVTMIPGGAAFIKSSALTPDGRILVAGSLGQGSSIDFGGGPIGGAETGFVFSLAPNGTFEWGRGGSRASMNSVASDPRGNAIVTGWAIETVNFGGPTHTGTVPPLDFIARFSPTGAETDFRFYGDPNLGDSNLYAATDRAGNLYLRGRQYRHSVGNQPNAVSFGGGPAVAQGLPYFMALNAADEYRYGFSLPGSNANQFMDHAIANDGAAWYAGYQRGGLAVGSLHTPDPGAGEGGLLLRASPTGTVDELRCYPGGYFMAVDADSRGRPVVGGSFRGGVDFGTGMIPMGNPSVIVARLNLTPRTSSGGTDSGVSDARPPDAGSAPTPVEFAVTFDVDPNTVDVAADRVSGATYAEVGDTLVKLRPDGTIAWQKVVPGVGFLSASIVADRDGNVIIASGYLSGTDLGLPADAGVAPGPGLFVGKYEPDGTTVFEKTWSGGPANRASSGTTPDGRILVTGYMNAGSFDFGDGPIGGQGGSFVISLRPDGTFEWSRGSENLFIRSVTSDPQGGAIIIGSGAQDVSLGGATHPVGASSQLLTVRFSPSGTETEFHTYGEGGSEIFGATDRAGNLYLGGHFNPFALNGGGPLVSFNDGPALALGFPYFFSLTSAGNYRYGSSLVGYSNWLSDVAIANDGTAWYAGSQRGALAVGSLLSPDPGEGGLLLRASSKGVVDKLRSYPTGIFLAVDVDGQGRPVVAGKFRGGVDFGAGMITVGNPSVVIAKLNP